MTELEELRKELQELKTQVSTLSRTVGEQADVIDNHVGIDWGASGMGQPHPTQLNFNREIHGPSKTSVDSTHDMEFPVDFDATVQYLHQSKLTVRMFPVRSNVSTAASGGSSTSGSGGGTTATSTSGGAATSSSGGGQTTSSGASHTHSFSGGTSGGGGAHAHVMFDGLSATPTLSTDSNNVGHTHAHGDPTTGANSVTHLHGFSVYRLGAAGGQYIEVPTATSFQLTTYETTSDHTHSFSGGTSGSEASHTHTVNNHTHTVGNHTHDVTLNNHTHSTPNHSHDLTYGIYEGSAPSTPQVTIEINGVDRTTALGGPWDDDFTVDITQYVRDPISGQPLRPTNEIVLGSSELIDTEMTVKSFVSCVTPFILGVQS